LFVKPTIAHIPIGSHRPHCNRVATEFVKSLKKE